MKADQEPASVDAKSRTRVFLPVSASRKSAIRSAWLNTIITTTLFYILVRYIGFTTAFVLTGLMSLVWYLVNRTVFRCPSCTTSMFDYGRLRNRGPRLWACWAAWSCSQCGSDLVKREKKAERSTESHK